MFFRKKRPDARKAADPETAPPAAADPETAPPAAADPETASPAAPPDASPPEGLSPTSPAVVSRASDEPASPGAAARVPRPYDIMEADGAPSTGPNVENPAEAELLKRFFATIKAVPEERRASVYRVAIAAAERSARGEDVEADASRPHSYAARVETGVVDWFGDQYGFVRRDGGGDDLFVHRANVRRHGALEAGDAVEFVVAWDGRVGRLEARDVGAPGAPEAPRSDGKATGVLDRAPRAAYGFIRRHGPQLADVFVHESALPRDARAGDAVAFRVDARDGRPRAVDVEALPRRRRSSASSASSAASTAPARRRSSASSASSRRSSGLRAEGEVRLPGAVTWFQGSYGFIRPDDGSPDVFVHAAATGDVPGGLEAGDRVDFRVARFNGRDRAQDVRRAAASLVAMAPIGHRPPAAAPIGPPGAEAYRPVLDKQTSEAYRPVLDKQTSLARSVFARADSDRGEPPPEEARQVADDVARAPP